jgi:hypothetical protein
MFCEADTDTYVTEQVGASSRPQGRPAHEGVRADPAGGAGDRVDRDAGERGVAIFARLVLTQIYLCEARSAEEVDDGNASGQYHFWATNTFNQCHSVLHTAATVLVVPTFALVPLLCCVLPCLTNNVLFQLMIPDAEEPNNSLGLRLYHHRATIFMIRVLD